MTQSMMGGCICWKSDACSQSGGLAREWANGAYYCAGASVPEEVKFAMDVANLVSCWACRAKERDDVSVGILKLLQSYEHERGVEEGNVGRSPRCHESWCLVASGRGDRLAR